MDSEYRQILQIVNRIRRRWKFYLVLEGILYSFALLLAWLLVGILSDNLFHLPLAVRAIFLFGLLALAGYLFYRRIVSSLVAKITPDQAALHAESRIKNIDNRLINTLQLGRSKVSGNTKIIESIVRETLAGMKQMKVERAIETTRVRNYLFVLSVALVALVTYWIILPAHFANAFERLTQLGNAPAPLTRIVLQVEPGDTEVFAGDDLRITAEPVNGELPEEAFIERTSEGKTSRDPMSFDGTAFAFTIPNILHETTYRVIADDFASQTFTITTAIPLKLEKIDTLLTFPDYLGLADPLDLQDTPEELRLVKGTSAAFTIFSNKPLESATMKLDSSDRQCEISPTGSATANLDVMRDLTYRFQLEDTKGGKYDDPMDRRIYCIIDEAPAVEFLEPTEDFTGSVESKLKFIIKARDDVALGSITLVLGKEGQAKETDINSWTYNEAPVSSLDMLKTMAIESCEMPLADHFSTGEKGFIYARARDLKGSTVETRKIAITVISAEQEESIAREEKQSILDKLREILDLQVGAYAAFAAIKSEDVEKINEVKTKQTVIYEKSVALVDHIASLSSSRHDDIMNGMRDLSSNEIVDVIRMIDGLPRSYTGVNRAKIAAVQKDIENELRRLLGEVSSGKKDDQEQEAEDETGDANEDEAKSKLQDLATALRNFISEQRRVIESSEELAAKRPEDFTEADHELRRKIGVIEDQWAEFLDEKSTELDKIPDQDFSKPTLLKELRQIYEEIDLAADELTKPGVHIPVTEEEVGLELAKTLEAKLESWLVNESDKIKWEMEEPSTDIDVPMAELPEELEDLIGDLIREEEDLDSQMEDVSSSWVDSLDEGAGWDTMDGPISNMSAKGKTGNTLPNSSEISGRSGEGRQGKSNGEFVSDTAIGKGGRRTPTRLMNDAYEKGEVNDEMTQETGGATGGGKLSGTGGEGVRGHVPPDVQSKITKVREKYSDIINRGERIAHQLDVMGYSPDKLNETIEAMRHLDYSMRDFKYTDVLGVHREIIEGLETSKDVLGVEMRVRSEENAQLPKKIRRLLNDAMTSEFPEEYEELLKGYYKSISR